MGIPDSFNPLEGISSARNMGDAPAPATPGDSVTTPGDVAQMSGTQNIGATTRDVSFGGDTNSLTPGGVDRVPADVNRFNGAGR